jgi:hypothetical protein
MCRYSAFWMPGTQGRLPGPADDWQEGLSVVAWETAGRDLTAGQVMMSEID